MLYIKNVLFLVTVVHVSSNFFGNFAAIQRDVRTDSAGACTTGLLKNLSKSSFSASSILRNEIEFGPQSVVGESFYDVGSSRNAWCPDRVVSTFPSEWLQVDFNSTKIIKNVFTLGRDDGNYGEFVTNYYFDYQRENAVTWYRYRDRDLKELIKGNEDARNSAHNTFETPIVAKRIRIIPINLVPKKVCLKIALYGCNFNDGVVEYQIPKGNKYENGSSVMYLDDDRYDNTQLGNATWLHGGMGKLMDNVVPTNIYDSNEIQKFTVAWSRSLQHTSFIELRFRFDTLRHFRSLTLYPAVIPPANMVPLSSIVIDFYESDSDTTLTHSHTKNILSDSYNGDQIFTDLNNELAAYIRMKLFFKFDWMGLNEIVFNSTPAAMVTDPPPVPPLPISLPVHVLPTNIPIVPSSKFMIHVTLIACVTGAFILMLILAVICFVWVRQRNRRRYKSKLSDYRTILLNDSGYPSNINVISGTIPTLYRPSDPHLLGPSTISTMGFRYIQPPIYPSCQEYRVHSITNSNDYEPIDSYWPRPPHQTTTMIKDTSIDQLDRQTLLVPAMTPDITNNIDHGYHGDSAATLSQIYGSVSAYSSHPYDNGLSVPDIIPPATAALSQDIMSDIYNYHINNPLRGVLGSSMFFCHLIPMSQVWIDQALTRLQEITATDIVPQKHVSEGDLGHISSGLSQDCSVGFIVATIKRNKPNVESKYAFYRQCLISIKEDFTSHPNLLPLVGRSKRDSLYPSILYAYPSQLNVVTFFHKLRKIPRIKDVSFSCSSISQNSLLYLMKQLADALAFLDESAVVHRDVAARNCSIGDHFHLILSDFALGLDEFKDDYTTFYPPQYQSIKDRISLTRTVQLPLLWMPWEAIMMGNYTTMSDVWSFGVTLWEIFTECQLKPYSTSLPLSSTSDPTMLILNNSLLIANNHRSAILPNGRTIEQSKPNTTTSTTINNTSTITDISKHVRDIMHLCWQSNPLTRPNFQTLYSIIAELSPELRYTDEYGTLRRLIT